ncbi:hypothetical protein AVEN_143860-1 [Araneus ventricosus]|uniref:Uncharacterized protein n=1 Tax=Araneus ventricosus TaxID=182803 RepID=A0A4Y2SF07_ARAVE|nr:hypothetical protein AVEN_69027-1 [Araneus ventricosus]GBN86672.1 hypothetical protein AVEN_143860-1 [Araneus ventricosus]
MDLNQKHSFVCREGNSHLCLVQQLYRPTFKDEKESEKSISGEIGRYPEVKPYIQHGITGVVIGSYASQLEPKNDTEESDTYMAKEKV